MSGMLDTSIIVRYLTGDVVELARRAEGIIDTVEGLVVTDLVLAETAYVLTSVYKVPRDITVDTLVSFVRKKNISTFPADKGTVIEALLMCQSSGRVSFADAMLWAEARCYGPGTVYTLDERFPGDGIDVRSGR